MADQTYKIFFSRLYHNAYSRSKRIVAIKQAFLTVHFTENGQNIIVAEKVDTSEIANLTSLAEYKKPEKIFAIIDVDGKKTMYEQSFIQNEQLQELSNNSQTNNKGLQKISNKFQTNLKQMEAQALSSRIGFAGFGETNVKEYVNKVLAEERRERDFVDLKSELEAKKEEIQKLNNIITEFEETLDTSEDKLEKLEEELESKKKIRYWAGMTGDILESIGFKKEALRQPLAGFLTGEESSESLSQNNIDTDESGIVEEEENDKRSELINLIHSYLHKIDDKTLANIFLIFSEIERDRTIANKIIEQFKIQR